MRHLDFKRVGREEAEPLLQPIHHGMNGRFGDDGFGAQRDDGGLVSHFDGREAEQLGQHPQLHHFQESLHRLRRKSVPVLDFSVEKGQFTDLLAGGQPLVPGEPVVRIFYVRFRNKRRDRDAQCGIRFLFDRMPLEPLHGLLDHLEVEIQADGGDVAGLRFAEEIAGSADFEVGCGDSKSGAQLRKLLNGNQPLLGIFRETAFIGNQQIGVRLFSASDRKSTRLNSSH